MLAQVLDGERGLAQVLGEDREARGEGRLGDPELELRQAQQRAAQGAQVARAGRARREAARHAGKVRDFLEQLA